MRPLIPEILSVDRNPKAQAAMEFISIYGLAFLIIAVAVAAISAYLVLPAMIVPKSCTIQNFASCSDFNIGVNTISTSGVASFVLVNSQSYPIENPSITLQINGVNTTPSNCIPNIVGSGGTMICNANIVTAQKIGSPISGTIYLSAGVCGYGTYSASGCSAPEGNTVATGKFNTQVEGLANTVITAHMGSEYSIVKPNGASDNIYTLVELGGIPLPGISLEYNTLYESNGMLTGSSFGVSPDASNVNATGVGLTSVYGYTPGNIVVSASLGPIFLANTLVQFEQNPPSIGVSINGIDEFCNNKAVTIVATASGGSGNYDYNWYLDSLNQSVYQSTGYNSVYSYTYASIHKGYNYYYVTASDTATGLRESAANGGSY